MKPKTRAGNDQPFEMPLPGDNRRIMVPRRFWTIEENERLKALAADGHSVAEIAKSLSRTSGAVRWQGRVLGIKFPAPPGRTKEPVARRLSGRFDRVF